MAKKATGSPHSSRRLLMLSWLLGVLTMVSAYAQSPASCSDVERSDITTTAATCEGNGVITAPTFNDAFYTLTGENVSYEVGPQNSGSFISLSPGLYTLKILCEGSTTPIEITGIEVESNWQQLDLALTPAITCPGQGTMTAVASFGFNKGGAGAIYEFAIWQGSAGAPDGDLTWVTPAGAPLNQHVFTGLATGNYNVRVRDNCGNIWTESRSIGNANTPTVDLSRSSAWVCVGGTLVKRVTLNVGSLPAAPLRWSGYKYKVEYVAGTSNCGTQTVIGAPIVAETVVADDGWPKSFDLDNIPAGAGAYRITTISPCGEVSYNCQSVTGSLPTITLRRSYASCATPTSALNTRLTYVINPNEFNSIQYPATITFTGQGGWTSGAITVGSSSELSGVVNNIPNSAYTVTATFVDACGVTLTQTINNPLGAPATTAPTPAYDRSCVDFGHTNLDYSFNGAYVGIGDAGTTYELYNAADNSLVTTGTLINTITNTVRFLNVPAPGSYYVKIVPAVSTGCSAQQLNSFTLPTGDNDPGARIVANPSIQQNCTEETSIWNWNYSTNNFTSSGRTIRFKVWKVGDDPVAGPFVRDATNSSNFVIQPGEYLWSITNDYTGTDCDRVLNATVPIVVGAVEWVPVIEKSVASVCQDENGVVLTTGIAILQFDGNGPFRIEQRDAANPNVNSWATVPGGASVAGPTFEINNLEAGKTYIFRVVDQCGRSVTQQVTIRPLSPRIIDRGAVQPCVDQDYVLQGIDYPGATYTWTKVGGGVVSNTRDLSFSPFTAADAGQYKLTLRLSTCLVRETTITLGTDGCGQPFQLGSLGDFVWYDTDYDGIQDPGEAPAPGVSVTLQGYVGPNPSNPSAADLANNANWADMETQLTGADGKYKFTDLEGGYYRVRFGDVADYTYTGYQKGASDPDNRGEGGDSNANPANGNYSGPVLIEVNHPSGDVRRDNMTIDAGLVRYGSIGDYVWYDTDLDGTQDAGEAPAVGVQVKLFKKEGDNWVEAGTTATDATGKYLFDNLKPGTYQVEFVKPSGYDFTQNYIGGASNTGPTDSDANRATGKSGEIVIDVSLPKGNVGRDNMTIDAGLVTEGALPVKLSHFNAEKTTEGTAHLTWSTTEETNSSYFDVLQSADGSNWQAIGRVKAKGNSVGAVRYAFTDQQPNRGLNYYRLKMVDLDGSFEHSNIRSLTFEGTPVDLSVYPNPVSDNFSIKLGAREKISKVELFDSNGRRAIFRDRYAAGESIATKGLSAGTYVLKVTMSNGVVEVRKIVISNK